MNAKIKLTIIGVFFALILSLGGFFALNPITKPVHAETVWSEIEINEIYALDAEFNVPERKVKIEDENITATSVVVLPDGTLTKKKTIKLSMSGEYIVRYTAVHNGKSYIEEERFSVKYKLASFSDSNSSYEYGVDPNTADMQGLKVSLAQYDILTFSPVIDMNELTAEDTLLEFYVSPSSVGEYDVKQLFFKFEDVEDSESYFRVRAMVSSDGVGSCVSYFLAAGNGQFLSGWEIGKNKLHVNNRWGAYCLGHSFYGVDNAGNNNVGKTKVVIRYDGDSKAVYVGQNLIIDFDNPQYFTTLWEGFKSGKVKVSMWAENYANASANFVITKMFGVDLKTDAMEETVPPVLTIDNDYETMPLAEVGKEYKIPTATAFDIYSGDCKVNTSVWFNYTSPENSALISQKDGKFVATYPGIYAIVYETQDRMTNKTTEILWVNAVSDVESPTIELDEDMTTECVTGDWIIPADYQVLGGSGNSNVCVEYTFAGETKDASKGFRADVAGKYTVTYTAEDYIGQTAAPVSYDIIVSIRNEIIFVEEPILPKYFIAGANYVLPDLYANDYSTGTLVRKLATVTVTDKNGTQTFSSGESYIPAIDTNMGKVTIVYTVGNAVWSKQIPVIIAWIEEGGRPRLHVENYFDTEGTTIERTADYSFVSATMASGKWTFANALLAENLTTTITAQIGKSEFDGIQIILQDSQDESIAICAYIERKGNASNFKTDAVSLGLDIGFSEDSFSNKFLIGYANGAFKISGASVKVNKTIDGEKFNGFPSGKVYLSISFVGATTGAQYIINEINTQTINTSPLDKVKPKIIILGERGGSKGINEQVVLPAAMSADTLDPNVLFSVTVVDPQGKAVKDVNGLELKDVDPSKEYTILLDQYGQYRVIYTSKDTFNATPNKQEYSYAITVEDSESPKISFYHDFQTTAKVGEVIIIPNFMVSDNVSASENIVITKYCLTPNGYLLVLDGESNSVRVAYEGIYEFRVIVMDESGNMTMHRQTIVVTA